ncbi:MAG: fasciclin domain-containing protein [Ilumatobacteraceae bacterium]
MRHRSLPRRPIVLTAALFGVVAIALGGCASDSDYSGNATTTTKRAQASTTTPSTISTVPATTAPSDIVGTALNGHMFNSLAGLAIQAGLVAALRGGPFTVFAPTDDAFAKLPLPVLHAVEDNVSMLTSVLQHHVVKGAIRPGDLVPGQLTTLAGDSLTVTRVGNRTYVDGNLVGPHIEATNGEVYVMGDVLVPRTATSSP